MTISKNQYDTDKYEICLRNKNGMIVKLLNYGATLEKILIPTDHGLENIILSLPSPSDYDKERNYLGGSVGRVIGRIKDGLWKTENNKTYHFVLNENNLTHSHGGLYGLDTQLFEAKTVESNNCETAIFNYLDKDGHNGYPGNMKIQIKYVLDNNNTLKYSVSAVSDKLTLCNIANHVYFCLDGPNTTIESNNLSINSDRYLPLDANHIPYEHPYSVDKTIFDLRNGKKIKEILQSNDSQIINENGLNHPFILKNNDFAVNLKSSNNNRQLTLKTSAPAIVAYTGNHFNHTGYAHNLGKHSGIALEAQIPPSTDIYLKSMILEPDKEFESWTTWSFKF